MTDITKCPGEITRSGDVMQCPDRNICYRYTAPAGEFQAMAIFWRPDREKLGLYDCFYPVESGEDERV